MSLLLLLKPSGAAPPQQDLTQASRFDNSSTFYSPALTGALTLTPSLFTNSQTYYTQEVDIAGAPHTVVPSLFTSTNAFYSHTVSTNYPLTAPLLTNSQSFYSSTLTSTYTLTPSRYDNTQTFYSPSLDLTLEQLARLDNTNTFYAQEVDVGTAPHIIAPALFTNSQQFFGPNVYVQVFYVLKYWNGTAWEIIYKDPVIYV